MGLGLFDLTGVKWAFLRCRFDVRSERTYTVHSPYPVRKVSLFPVAELFCFKQRAMRTVIDYNTDFKLSKLYTKGDDE
jgi:hypothetical protein